MKRKQLLIVAALILAAVTITNNLPTQACAFDTEPYFTYSVHPDLPLDSYARGRLGILQPSYARSYLFVAYRYLANQPLSVSEQKAAVDLWNKRLTASDANCASDTSGWLKARGAVPDATKLDPIVTERPINEKEPWQTYCNCQTSAFTTAAKTLDALTARFGATSAAVKDWANAQDEVFSNCGYRPYQNESKPNKIPESLPATTDAFLQKQRAYQIAAANFYAQNFDVAHEQFDRIAADNESPWKQMAAYLSVRTLIRKSTLGTNAKDPLLEAQKRLKELQADAANANMKGDLAELSDFVEVKLSPEKYLHQMLDGGPVSISNLGEITFTLDTMTDNATQQQNPEGATDQQQQLPKAFNKTDALDWVMTFGNTSTNAKHHAVERWQQTKSLPWLVAAISSVAADDPNANALVTAANAEEHFAPARWTLFYQTNRINMANGKDDAVRKELDKVISNPPVDLPVGALNQLRTQRLMLAQNLDDFVKFGIQTPQTIASNALVMEVPDDIDRIAKNEPMKEKPLTPEFIAIAGEALDYQMPLSVLTALAGDNKVPADLRNNVAWTSWVRAVLIGDDAAARQLAVIGKQLNKNKQPLFNVYDSATDPSARKFAATFLMLHFSSATPNPSSGPLAGDAYGDASGWWWAEKPVTSTVQTGLAEADTNTVKPTNFHFLTGVQKAQAKKELARLESVPGAPNYFASVVLPFAKMHPDDPRVPEALHWLIKSTRYGIGNDATKTYSKEAFTLLHTKYKTSPWTKKTPFYY